jgi:hypothetical protein
VVIAVMLFVFGPVIEHEQKHCYHHDTKVKPEAATAVVELLLFVFEPVITGPNTNKSTDITTIRR